MTRPKYLMPVHGDEKRQQSHAGLGRAVGSPDENIFVGENGLPLDLIAAPSRFP